MYVDHAFHAHKLRTKFVSKVLFILSQLKKIKCWLSVRLIIILMAKKSKDYKYLIYVFLLSMFSLYSVHRCLFPTLFHVLAMIVLKVFSFPASQGVSKIGKMADIKTGSIYSTRYYKIKMKGAATWSQHNYYTQLDKTDRVLVDWQLNSMSHQAT